jgi:hypothetical protein
MGAVRSHNKWCTTFVRMSTAHVTQTYAVCGVAHVEMGRVFWYHLYTRIGCKRKRVAMGCNKQLGRLLSTVGVTMAPKPRGGRLVQLRLVGLRLGLTGNWDWLHWLKVGELGDGTIGAFTSWDAARRHVYQVGRDRLKVSSLQKAVGSAQPAYMAQQCRFFTA